MNINIHNIRTYFKSIIIIFGGLLFLIISLSPYTLGDIFSAIVAPSGAPHEKLLFLNT